MAFTTVRSATGVDFIGTPGVDVGVFFNETGNVVASGLGGDDVITILNSTGIQRTTTLNGGDGNDLINVGTSLSESSVNGGLGRDVIDLGAFSVANSFVGAGDGSDEIFGGDQLLASFLNGGAGADTITAAVNLALATINGGTGNDTIILFNGAGQVFNSSSINGNAGNDIIDGTFLNVTLSGDNFIGAGADDDTVDFRNATTDNGAISSSVGFTLNGGSGNDSIFGSTEDDQISGGADNDTINGEQGEDTILAGAGDDLIQASNDVITGGAGADQYFFFGGTSTFLITAVANSAAATSGTERTFDSFAPYFGFVAGDELDITAVTNQLAGGQYLGDVTADQVDLGFLGAFSDFGALKAFIDINVSPFFDQSDIFDIESYVFSADIDAAGVTDYLWIQDSQRAFTSSDLLFEIDSSTSITGNFITVA